MPLTRDLANAAVLLSLMAEGALAENPRNYDANLSPGALIGVDSAWVPGHLEGWLGLGVTYANDELNHVDLDGTRRHEPLEARWIATLAGGLGLADQLELRAAVPLHYNAAAGFDGANDGEVGLGDVRVAVRWAIVRDTGLAGDDTGFGLALEVGLGLPTGGAAAFSSDDGLVLDPRLLLDWRSGDGVALALSLGYRVRPEAQLLDVAIDDELRFGAGLEVALGAFGSSAPVAFLAEIEGGYGLGTTTDRSFDTVVDPLEARLGVRVFGERWALTAATGIGLIAGYGAPDVRMIVGVSFSPGTLTGPRPLPVGPPTVVTAPEPVFADAPPSLGDDASFRLALKDDPDADGDRVLAANDRCAQLAEDLDGFQDDDGCPDLDDDADGVPDRDDRCPREPETLNGVADEDGCPDALREPGAPDPANPGGPGTPGTPGGPSTPGTPGRPGGKPAPPPLTITVDADGLIRLSQRIEFKSGSDVFTRETELILAQVAAMLKGSPHIRRLRIEGHTDNEGDPEMNVDLSERRAGRVRLALVALGVDGGRLLPRGYGSTRAITSNATPEGRKKNRRVELRIIDPPPAGKPHIDFEESP